MKVRLAKKQLKRSFPKPKSSKCRITSPKSAQYNCIAWAAGDVRRWWQPGYYWPSADQSETIESLVKVFESIGFTICSADDMRPEAGCEKIALYADSKGYTHAAKLLDDGIWSSKLGKSYDISHGSPEELTSTDELFGTRKDGAYGKVRRIMKRHRQPSETEA